MQVSFNAYPLVSNWEFEAGNRSVIVDKLPVELGNTEQLIDVTEIIFIRNRLISDHPGRKFSGKSAFI